jgi:phage terminase large subunit
MNAVAVNDSIVPAYVPVMGATSRYVVLYGGAGSGKSYFCAQVVILRAMLSRHRIAIIRKVARTLRQSVFARILSQLNEWGIRSVVNVNKSEMLITFPNGSELLFVGLDDPEKLKSIDSLTSIWIEEATEISEADFTQVDLRLRGVTKFCKQILLSFNPVSVSHWLKKRFFDNPSEGETTVLKTTFRDNPHCDEEYSRMFDDLEARNPDLFRIYGKGEWGILKGLIYPNHRVVESIPEDVDVEGYGLDFGFNAPSALIWLGLKDVNWTRRTGTAYVREVLYESQLSNTELGDRMRALGVNARVPIYADAAEPARIKELRKQGFNIKPANKGKGSVQSGIGLLKSMDLQSHKDNVNVNRELSTYSWEVDKDDKPLDRPLKFDDHAMDALRYCVWSMMKSPRRTIKGK